MNEQPTRYSQAQLLIAALFAVVLTGEMPECGLTSEGRIEPLDQEFSDVFGDRRHIAGRLARVSLIGLPDDGPNYERRTRLIRSLARTPTMPSEIARTLAEELCKAGGQDNPEYFLRHGANLLLWRRQGVVPSAARKCGVDSIFVTTVWGQQDWLDQAWHLCREELLKIRAERQAVKRG